MLKWQQRADMHLLFLCSQNKRRSLTAEKLFDGQNGHQARSAGTENNARVKVTPGLLGWADIVSDKQIVCLNILDDYSYIDDDLCELLESVV